MNNLNFYLENTTLTEIFEADKQARDSGREDEVKFRHTDSTVIFTPDTQTKFIYASDVDDNTVDLFSGCHIPAEFKGALEAHYGDLTQLREALDDIDGAFEFTNGNETGSARVCEVLAL